MREFYRRHRGLHRWLLAVVALLAVYFALRPVPGLMNWLSRHVIMPWERAVASVCYLFRTSIAEVLYIVLLSVGIFYVFFLSSPALAPSLRPLMKSSM